MSDSLPITSIYVLGFSFPGLETACLRIGRGYYDLIEEREIAASDCYIVQTPLITGRLKTRLDMLLSVFEQKNFTDKSQADKRYDYPISDEGVKEMTDILHYISTDPEARKALDDERYYREYLQETFGDLYAEIAVQNKKILAREAEIAAMDTEIVAKEAEIVANKAELAAKDTEIAAMGTEIATKDSEIAELKKKLELATPLAT